jgi:hypothetical protein
MRKATNVVGILSDRSRIENPTVMEQ